MSTLPTYMIVGSQHGRLMIFRSDGMDITADEVAWFRATITAAMRTKHLMENAKTNLDAALAEPDVAEGVAPRTGSLVRVHPLVNQLKGIIKARGWQLAALSRLLGKNDAAMSTWFRGQAAPTMKDVYGSFGLAGYQLVPVPLSAVSEVKEFIKKAEDDLKQEDIKNSME